MVPGLCEVVPEARVTPPSVQWLDLCSSLPSPTEPVCWLQFVGFGFVFSKLLNFSCDLAEPPGALSIDKEVTVNAAI